MRGATIDSHHNYPYKGDASYAPCSDTPIFGCNCGFSAETIYDGWGIGGSVENRAGTGIGPYVRISSALSSLTSFENPSPLPMHSVAR